MKGDLAGYRKWAAFQVEALNHALKGIPEDGPLPHLLGKLARAAPGDVPLKDVVELLLKVKAQAYVDRGRQRPSRTRVENLERHEVAGRKGTDPRRRQSRDQRAGAPRFGRRSTHSVRERVGRENVFAGTDCGLGGRVHPQIAWAKLPALAEGAKLASKALWT